MITSVELLESSSDKMLFSVNDVIKIKLDLNEKTEVEIDYDETLLTEQEVTEIYEEFEIYVQQALDLIKNKRG